MTFPFLTNPWVALALGWHYIFHLCSSGIWIVFNFSKVISLLISAGNSFYIFFLRSKESRKDISDYYHRIWHCRIHLGIYYTTTFGNRLFCSRWFAFSCLIVLPPWPFFRRNPLPWQPIEIKKQPKKPQESKKKKWHFLFV